MYCTNLKMIVELVSLKNQLEVSIVVLAICALKNLITTVFGSINVSDLEIINTLYHSYFFMLGSVPMDL